MTNIKLIARTPFYRGLYIKKDADLSELEEDFNTLLGADAWEYMKAPMSKKAPQTIIVVKTDYGRIPITPGSWLLVDDKGAVTTHGYREFSHVNRGFAVIPLTDVKDHV